MAARIPNFGASQPVSNNEFQERLKRIFAQKPELPLPPMKPVRQNKRPLPPKA